MPIVAIPSHLAGLNNIITYIGVPQPEQTLVTFFCCHSLGQGLLTSVSSAKCLTTHKTTLASLKCQHPAEEVVDIFRIKYRTFGMGC